jgi:aryl-alcohol dehydrogenase-like predicted oxidoreductase
LRLPSTVRVLPRLRTGSCGEVGHENFEHNLRAVEEVKAMAVEVGSTPGQIALAWVLAKSDNLAAIPGTKRVSRVEENCAADAVSLTREQISKLDGLTPAAGEHHNEAQMKMIER